MRLKNIGFIAVMLTGVLSPHSIFCGDKNPSREEGRFEIYVADKKVGQEKFSIVRSSDSVISSSTANFGNPAGKGGNIKIETQLNMDGEYMPKTYEVRTEIGGRRQTIKGTFAPSQAAFEYLTDGIPRKNGLLVGDRYAILDTNVFHHYIFAMRLFDFRIGGKSQSIDAVIPQEIDAGILKIIDVGREQVSLRGKRSELHHLKADSGSLQIDLWVDEAHVLYKIALPSKRLEAIRH